MRKLLIDNTYANAFTLNGENLSHYTEKKKREEKERKRLRKKAEQREREIKAKEEKRKKEEAIYKSRLDKLQAIPSSAVMIIVDFKDGISENYIIVNKRADANELNHIYLYSSPTGRELLSAAFFSERNKKGELFQTEFTVTDIVEKQNGILDSLLIRTITLKKGGGMHSNKYYEEVVDMLLYSPFRQDYEIIHATHDTRYNYYYIDPKVFFWFTNKYGFPIGFIPVYPDYEQYGGFKDWGELNPESILYAFGYNVSQNKALSSDERRRILMDIVDLGIKDVQAIVSHLDFCITTHTSNIYEIARKKWKSDREFIKSYKANPDRFLILETKS